MGFSSRRPHRVPLLSAKNRKQRLQFAQAHQNWTIKDWKTVAWSDESRFLLWHSDGRVRLWHKEHESMDPSCLVSTVQAGGCGEIVWDIFLVHPLYHYIYIYAFNRHFYPKQLTYSGYNFFYPYVCSLVIEPTTFCAANAMLYHWATGTLSIV